MSVKSGGVRLPHHKSTENKATLEFPLPRKLILPMAQCMGAPCTPLVKKGDEVSVGMKIGDSDKPMSVPVHSPASGKVSEITDWRMSNGAACKAVVIETDGLQTVSPEVIPPKITDRSSFLAAVRESGCCGLGGAGFPTHIKLGFDPKKTPIDTLLINGAECEPYITSDYREFVESPEDVIDGISYIMKMLEIPSCKIGIEANKPAAIAEMKKRTSDNPNIEVVTLPSSYPQGAEKVLILTVTGRLVAEGELPAHQGVIVMNVSTVSFLMRYIRTGMPLVSRRLTIDGDAVTKNSGNYRVLIGTPASELLEYCGASEYKKVLYGGPMMGMALDNADRPVIKVNNAILAFNKLPENKTTSCIRCGRCVRACPVDLMPVSLESAYDRGDIAELERLKVRLCINCGCCTFVCPANRHLAEKNQLAKGLLMKAAKRS
ncbi:MAG: electron transport complex subunit RsxC [Oscillospiraceae bacterium]|nr:electron transport complex subunit RsxC [Oscillospiraceae bacterium]